MPRSKVRLLPFWVSQVREVWRDFPIRILQERLLIGTGSYSSLQPLLIIELIKYILRFSYYRLRTYTIDMKL